MDLLGCTTPSCRFLAAELLFFAAAFDSFRGDFLPRLFTSANVLQSLTRFGAFLPLIAAVTVPSLISRSPSQDGHFRREETITLCIEVYTICSLQSGQASSLTGRTGGMATRKAFAYPSP